MDARYSPGYSQKADVKRISFVLDAFGSLGTPVVLPIRPEDLTRTEPQRAAVHQSLGRTTQGWVDHFGAGLPTVTISGHTGWGYKPGIGKEGFESFEALNKLVVHDYPAARQTAIDAGLDPDKVKLLFVDLLDNFAYPVVPMQFALRRSKSSPLLFRYNMVMQAVDTSVDGGIAQFMPPGANPTAGLNALGGALDRISRQISATTKAVFSVLRGIANTVMGFVNMAVRFLRKVQGVAAQISGFVTGTSGLVTGTAGFIIGIAKAIAQVGREIFRTFAAIERIGTSTKSAFMQIGAAFNEVVCVFSNALRPGTTYEDYTGLYGASNCSSTTGGRMPSAFTNQNVFAVINPNAKQPVSLSGAAISSANAINRSDGVLMPLPTAEIGRHLDNINAGLVVTI
jgi:hypothetical protein